MRLAVENVSFGYRKLPVIEDISFAVEGGDFMAVLGPNGVGKSTLFKCVLGAISGYTGRILIDGVDVKTLTPGDLSRRIAYIPQIHTPVFGFSVLDTVLMGLTGQMSPFSKPGRAQEQLAMTALEQLGVGQLYKRGFTHLSGGEQQLVLIARAIVQKAGILVMDEPTSSLDYGNQLRVLNRVKTLTKEGYAVLLSTHNPQHALSFADRVLALSGGRVAAYDKPDTALTPELMEKLYGVEVEFVETSSGRVIAPVLTVSNYQ